MSPRLRPALAGAALCASGWALGSAPLAVAGAGLFLAGALGAAWSQLALRAAVTRTVSETTLTEGDTLQAAVVLRRVRWLPGTFRFHDRVEGLAAAPALLRRARAVRVELPALPRGIHRLGPGTLDAHDPLGLVRVGRDGPVGPTVRVRPRIVELDGTFIESGRAGVGGRRRAAARPTGSEPVGVREYREGESLRAVHWASSARRGRLIVRELAEPPLDENVVVLDLDARWIAGPAGASSLDDGVRVAGALVRAQAAGGRRVSLVLAAARPSRLSVGSLGAEWEAALDALTGVQAAPGSCAADVVGRGGATGAGLVLVTGRPLDGLVEPLLRHGGAAVVALDAPTYAGAARSAAGPALLRLAAHGVPVAVVRAGDDLVRVLSRPAARRHA